jgi:hypothetical protein
MPLGESIVARFSRWPKAGDIVGGLCRGIERMCVLIQYCLASLGDDSIKLFYLFNDGSLTNDALARTGS